MIAKEYARKLDSTIKQRNIVLLCLIASCIVIILLIILLFTRARTVVLLPSGLQSEMRISTNGTATKSYIEQFTRDVMHTMLNITPSSVKYAGRSILKISSPKLHSSLAHQFATYEKDVINKNISTYFALHNITFLTEDNLQIQTEGELLTYIGKELISKQNKKYKLIFALNGTKVSLVGFNEVEEVSNLQLESINIEEYEEERMKRHGNYDAEDEL